LETGIVQFDHFGVGHLFENIRVDIARYNLGGGPFKCGQDFLFAYGLQAVLVYRFGQWVKRRFGHPGYLPLRWSLILIYKLFARTVRGLYGIHLSSSAKIGAGLKIGHFGGIEVGACSLGSNCSIQQHVKIGEDVQTKGAVPKIASSVWIGAHSRITGDITIADGATIGAGATVDKDVAGRCLVLGRPARVINKNYDNREILDSTF